MVKDSIFKKSTSIIIALVILVLMGFLLAGPLMDDPPSIVYKSCAQKMARNVCTIMNLEPNFSREVKQIYLPEYGALDADTYRILLRAGPGMCQVIRDSCRQNLKSDVCLLGLVLYK